MGKNIEITSTSESIRTLCSIDQRLSKLIQLVGDLKIVLRENYFESLAMSIIGQQLSSKAATTIKNRVKILCNGEVTAEKIKTISHDELRAAGVSRAKIEYIKDLAEKVSSEQLDFDNIGNLGNIEVIDFLTAVKGIGKWTAEMFLIFSLGRTDVMSYGDAGLQRATRWIYEFPEIPKYNYLKQLDSLWFPYQSIVSLYLWESIDRGFVDSGKSLDELVKLSENKSLDQHEQS